MIRVGIGGWTYKPWRETFYPKGLRQADELAYAAERLTSIEINGTFYRAQKPESFAAWREAVPEGFVFSVKGHRAVVNKKEPEGQAESLGWFLASGVMELGPALGPFLWQLPPHRRFDRDAIARFLDLLPAEREGRALRHAVEAPHESFRDPAFVSLLAEREIALVVVEKDGPPDMADTTAPFVYLRLQDTQDGVESGYPADALDRWASRLRVYAEGAVPDDLPILGDPPRQANRDVFVYMIAGAKHRAPAAALALIERLRD